MIDIVSLIRFARCDCLLVERNKYVSILISILNRECALRPLDDSVTTIPNETITNIIYYLI